MMERYDADRPSRTLKYCRQVCQALIIRQRVLALAVVCLGLFVAALAYHGLVALTQTPTLLKGFARLSAIGVVGFSLICLWLLLRRSRLDRLTRRNVLALFPEQRKDWEVWFSSAWIGPNRDAVRCVVQARLDRVLAAPRRLRVGLEPRWVQGVLAGVGLCAVLIVSMFRLSPLAVMATYGRAMFPAGASDPNRIAQAHPDLRYGSLSNVTPQEARVESQTEKRVGQEPEIQAFTSSPPPSVTESRQPLDPQRDNPKVRNCSDSGQTAGTSSQDRKVVTPANPSGVTQEKDRDPNSPTGALAPTNGSDLSLNEGPAVSPAPSRQEMPEKMTAPAGGIQEAGKELASDQQSFEEVRKAVDVAQRLGESDVLIHTPLKTAMPAVQRAAEAVRQESLVRMSQSVAAIRASSRKNGEIRQQSEGGGIDNATGKRVKNRHRVKGRGDPGGTGRGTTTGASKYVKEGGGEDTPEVGVAGSSDPGGDGKEGMTRVRRLVIGVDGGRAGGQGHDRNAGGEIGDRGVKGSVDLARDRERTVVGLQGGLQKIPLASKTADVKDDSEGPVRASAVDGTSLQNPVRELTSIEIEAMFKAQESLLIKLTPEAQRLAHEYYRLLRDVR